MEDWDFFISYKWNTYADEAKTLKTIAVARGFTAWLDVDHPFQTARYASEELDVALGRHLRQAIDSWRYVLFFEASATMATQVGGPPIRELGMVGMNKLVTFYHDSTPKLLAFSQSSQLHEYRELTDAFSLFQSGSQISAIG